MVVRDALVVGLLVASFATLLTAHLFIAIRLALNKPRYRGPLALLVVPLAPYFARENRWRAAWVWLASAGVYALALALAQM